MLVFFWTFIYTLTHLISITALSLKFEPTMAIAVVPTSFTVFLCVQLLSFTSSLARSPLDDETNRFFFPESDTTNPNGPRAIHLLSDNSDSEVLTSDSDADSDPLSFTLVAVRHLNPHFPRRPPPLYSRFGCPCRHSHHFKPFNYHLPRRDIAFADDLTLRDVDETDFDPVPRGGGRQIPARWTRSRYVEQSFSDDHGEDKREREEMTERRDHTEPERDEDGFMMKIRKFLNRF